LMYFVFCAIEGLARVSKNHVEAAKQKQFAALPLVITEIVIFYWIFTSLVSTMRTLKLRRNEIKLTVYRHFMNTLVFAVIASVIFMLWSLVYHIFPTCLKDWKELWVDTAFWHVLFCFILVVIVILWRPSVNNQRYAFTPLLDDSEDENDQDEIFNVFSAPGFELLKQRESGSAADIRRQKEKEREDHRLQPSIPPGSANWYQTCLGG
uniref:Transmembrane protein 87B n=1 Tax=Angiostrongylus cantonensis TaxID=6313 RepID=A0A0K0D7G3_ANGCA